MTAGLRNFIEQANFGQLRDYLAEQALAEWLNKPITAEAAKGATRAVEFARQCNSLFDFEQKWMKRQLQGLGLMDAWSIFASDQPRPCPRTEARVVNSIYDALLFAAGSADHMPDEARKKHAMTLTQFTLQKAKYNATSSAPKI